MPRLGSCALAPRPRLQGRAVHVAVLPCFPTGDSVGQRPASRAPFGPLKAWGLGMGLCVGGRVLHGCHCIFPPVSVMDSCVPYSLRHPGKPRRDCPPRFFSPYPCETENRRPFGNAYPGPSLVPHLRAPGLEFPSPRVCPVVMTAACFSGPPAGSHTREDWCPASFTCLQMASHILGRNKHLFLLLFINFRLRLISCLP